MNGVLDYIAKGVSKYSRRAAFRWRQYRYWRGSERRVRMHSAQQIKANQWKRLKRILRYAYSRIPLYRDKFRETGLTPDDIAHPDDLRRLPLLTKDEVRRNFPDRLVSSERTVSPNRLGQTSGSTAESMHFFRPEVAWQRDLYYTLFLRTRGMWRTPVFVLATPHCTAATCSIEEDRSNGQVWISKVHKVPPLRPLDRMIALPSSEDILGASDDYMERLRELLCRHSPSIVVADPVYLASFARYLRVSGGPVPRLLCIISTYELLTGSMKDLFRKVFGCDIYTNYGASEVLNVANECRDHKLHIVPDNVWVEVLRDVTVHGFSEKSGDFGLGVRVLSSAW